MYTIWFRFVDAGELMHVTAHSIGAARKLWDHIKSCAQFELTSVRP